jgi:hypothetical protein
LVLQIKTLRPKSLSGFLWMAIYNLSANSIANGFVKDYNSKVSLGYSVLVFLADADGSANHLNRWI